MNSISVSISLQYKTGMTRKITPDTLLVITSQDIRFTSTASPKKSTELSVAVDGISIDEVYNSGEDSSERSRFALGTKA